MTNALEWGEEQWSAVNQAVHDEALRARVAASFLPLFGPLPADTQSVPLNKLDLTPTSTRLEVNDFDTARLTTVSVNVYLKGAQVADPELAAAMIMFRRAALISAQVEDQIIFNGQPGVGKAPASASGIPKVYSVGGGGTYPGLVKTGQPKPVPTPGSADPTGPQVFDAVVGAVNELSSAGYLGPYACVMGSKLFQAATTPMPGSMVLPRDSILPFLDGPLLRSSIVPARKAVIVSLQGAPVEIVVPSDIAVKYLQTSSEGEHVFRVQQKFLLRVKEAGAVSTITL